MAEEAPVVFKKRTQVQRKRPVESRHSDDEDDSGLAVEKDARIKTGTAKDNVLTFKTGKDKKSLDGAFASTMSAVCYITSVIYCDASNSVR